MRLRFVVLVFVLALGVVGAFGQSGAGAKFGARDPRTCASRKNPVKGAPTADQLKQYFICDYEQVSYAWGPGALTLVADVTVEVGKGRPFNIVLDSFSGIDPAQTVYPIRGRYTLWNCGELGKDGNEPGHSCQNKIQNDNAVGICYQDSFGDWHCKFLGKTLTFTNACPGTGGATACRIP